MLGRDKVIPNEFLEGEVLEADCVISTLPVWNVLRVVPESALPDWYVAVNYHRKNKDHCPSCDT